MRAIYIKIIFTSAFIFINLINACPTRLGLDLLSKNQVSYKDIQDLNANNLDFKSTDA